MLERPVNPTQLLVSALDQVQAWENRLELKRGELLKEANTTDTHIYRVKSGSLRVFVVDGHEEHTIRLAYQGNILVALDSFFTEEPSDLVIEALKRGAIDRISKSAFFAFLNAHDLWDTWHATLPILILQQMERERDLLTSSPAERYQRVLKRSPQVFQEIPHKYIAAYLRMTPETLSRLQKS
jgi:CRP-like cAMP-binding protein